MKKLTAESVIKLYKSDEDFGFILDIEDVLRFLKDKISDNELSKEERAFIMYEIMKHNNRIYAKCEALQSPKKEEAKK